MCSNFSSVLSHETNSLFQCTLYHFPASKISLSSNGWLLCVSSPLFCSLRKITSKNLPLVSCFCESKFCWQSAEIRLPYYLGSLYAKWLAINPITQRVSDELRELREINCFDFVNTSMITTDYLWRDGIHLQDIGANMLSKNFYQVSNISFLKITLNYKIKIREMTLYLTLIWNVFLN